MAWNFDFLSLNYEMFSHIYNKSIFVFLKSKL